LYGRLFQELYLSIPANIYVSLVPRDSTVVFTVATIISIYRRVGLTTTDVPGPALSENRDRASMVGGIGVGKGEIKNENVYAISEFFTLLPIFLYI
jgi:ABC-type antimicrobial peptide transport system permease subunit